MSGVQSFDVKPPRVAYCDPSFLINLVIEDSKYYGECKLFSEKLKTNKTLLVMSNLGLDEIWYALLKIFAIRDYGEKRWQLKLKTNTELVKEYTKEIEDYTLSLLEIPHLVLITITADHTLLALDLMRKYGVFPRDSIHAAAAINMGVNSIITTDPDFINIGELIVYSCNPKITHG